MAPSLQLASASWQYRRQATHQPPRTDREQPVEAPQLGTIIPTTLLEQVDALTERRRAGNSVLVRRRVFMGIANCRGNGNLSVDAIEHRCMQVFTVNCFVGYIAS